MSPRLLSVREVAERLAVSRETARLKILVTGSRDWTDRERVYAAIVEWKAKGATTVIHGGASGADALAGNVALELGLEVRVYPADWARYGKGAGPLRNQRMLDVEHPDVVLAFPLDSSRGTWDMVRRARAAGTRVFICAGQGVRP